MEAWEIILTSTASTISVLIGAFVGGWLTRRGEDRKWFREKQLESYRDLFGHYLSIKIMLRRANIDRKGYDYDWAAWGASCLFARLMAPPVVATAIEKFFSEVDVYLRHTARDTTNDPLSEDELKGHEDRLEAAQDELFSVVENSLIGKSRQ